MNPLQLSADELELIRTELMQRYNELMSASWQPFSAPDGIQASYIHPKDGRITILRAESQLNCSAQTLFDYLVTNIDETCREWNDVMLYSGVIKKYDEQFEISRIVSEGNWLADREDVFIRCVGQLDNGSWYELSKGFDTTFIPIDTSISSYTVRSEMHFAAKEIIPIHDKKCHYRAIWHYDPSGWLSALLPRKILGKAILKNLIHEHQKLEKLF